MLPAPHIMKIMDRLWINYFLFIHKYLIIRYLHLSFSSFFLTFFLSLLLSSSNIYFLFVFLSFSLFRSIVSFVLRPSHSHYLSQHLDTLFGDCLKQTNFTKRDFNAKSCSQLHLLNENFIPLEISRSQSWATISLDVTCCRPFKSAFSSSTWLKL